MNRLKYSILLANFCLLFASTDYEILCDFAGATTVLDQVRGWSCSGNADVCVNGGSSWEGISCSADSLVESISLTSYSIYGTISSTLGLMTNLKSFAINNNMLYGAIPSSLGLLQNLIELDLSFNKLSKTIPSAIFSISKLATLKLYTNCLTGSIPSQIGLSKYLTIFDASNNKLSKAIPSSIGYASSLIVINVGPNQLTSTIPTTLGLLNSLTNLQLDGNSLYGNVPEQLCYAPLEKLVLYTYDFVLQRYSANFLWCYPNCLFEVPIRYYGPISNCTTNSSTPIPVPLDFNVLCDVVAATDISIRTNHTWNCTQGVPSSNVCLWIGVTCDSSTNVIQLDISDLKIKGTIPSSLGTLDDLSVLDLSDNSLYGSIPKQLGNCSKLQDLDISHNHFSDYIPTTLCNDKLKNITVDRDLVSSNTDLECYAACLTALAGFEGGVPQLSCSHSPTTAPLSPPSSYPAALPTGNNSSSGGGGGGGEHSTKLEENKNTICLNLQLMDTFGDGWEGGQLLLYTTSSPKQLLYSIPCGQKTVEVTVCIPVASGKPAAGAVTDKKDNSGPSLKMQRGGSKLCLQFVTLRSLQYPNEIFWAVSSQNNPSVTYTGNSLTSMTFLINDNTNELAMKFYKNPPSEKANCVTCLESATTTSKKYNDNDNNDLVTVRFAQNNKEVTSKKSSLKSYPSYDLQLSVLENNNEKYKPSSQLYNLCSNRNKECNIGPKFSPDVTYTLRLTSPTSMFGGSGSSDALTYCQETYSIDTEVTLTTSTATSTTTSTTSKASKKGNKYSSISADSASTSNCQIVSVRTLSDICSDSDSDSDRDLNNKKGRTSFLSAQILITLDDSKNMNHEISSTSSTGASGSGSDLKPLLVDALSDHFSVMSSLVSPGTSTPAYETSTSTLLDSLLISTIATATTASATASRRTLLSTGDLTSSRSSSNNVEGSQVTVAFQYPLPHPDIPLVSLKEFLQSSIESGLLQVRIQHHAQLRQVSSLASIDRIELLNINIIHDVKINKIESILGSMSILFLSFFALLAVIGTVIFIRRTIRKTVFLTNRGAYVNIHANTAASGAEVEDKGDSYPNIMALRGSSTGSTIHDHDSIFERENMHQIII